jgi:hypothetical protein
VPALDPRITLRPAGGVWLRTHPRLPSGAPHHT